MRNSPVVPEHDDAGDAGLELPVQERLESGDVDRADVVGERGDGDGVAALEGRGSVMVTSLRTLVRSVNTHDTMQAMAEGTPAGEVFDVAVVGGGATGCATAYYAATAGARVVLLDRHDLNTEASGRNAGSLHGQIQHEPFLHLGEEWARSWLPALRLPRRLARDLGRPVRRARHGPRGEEERRLAGRRPPRPAARHRAQSRHSRTVDRHREPDARRRGAARARAVASPTDAVGGELCPIEGKANPLLTAPAFARAADRRRGACGGTGCAVEAFRERGPPALVDAGGEVEARTVVIADGDGCPRSAPARASTCRSRSGAVQVSVTERVEPMVEHLVYYAGGKPHLQAGGGRHPAHRRRVAGAQRRRQASG